MSTPDFAPLEASIAQLDAFARDWSQRSAQIEAATAAAEVTLERGGLTLVVRAPQLLSVTFTTEAIGRGPVHLRDALLTGYAEGALASNQALAAALGQVSGLADVAAGVTASVPSEIVDRAAAAEAAESRPGAIVTAPTSPAAPDTDQPVGDPEGSDEAATILAEPGMSIEDVMADTEWATARPTGDPGNWQYDLERTVDALSARAATLAEDLERIRGEASSRFFSVEVNGAGALVDLRVLQQALQQTPEALAEDLPVVLAQASVAAREAVTELLAEVEHPADDPTEALFADFDAAARAVLEQAGQENQR